MTGGILISAALYLLIQGQWADLSLRQSDYDQLIMNWQCTPGFLIYLFLCRCLPFYLLIMITIRTRKSFFCHLYFGYIGFIYGSEVLISAFEYGISGWCLCFFRIMPQILFYAPALWIIWHMINNSSGHISSNIRQLFLIDIFLWTAGTLTEWFLNPYFLAHKIFFELLLCQKII